MTDTVFLHRAALLWIVLLTLASLLATWALACMTPFAALAALAASHLRGRDGATLMLTSWAASQAVGFGLLHYPHDTTTIAWGIALGFAALGAVSGGYAALAPLRSGGGVARVLIAFAAGFVAFKLVLLAADLVLGGSFASTIAPSLLVRQVPREAAIALALLALYRGLVSAGMPALPVPRRPVLA